MNELGQFLQLAAANIAIWAKPVALSIALGLIELLHFIYDQLKDDK